MLTQRLGESDLCVCALTSSSIGRGERTECGELQDGQLICAMAPTAKGTASSLRVRHCGQKTPTIWDDAIVGASFLYQFGLYDCI